MEKPSGLIEKVRWWRPAGVTGVEILEAENCSHLWKVFHTTYSICQIWDFPQTSAKWKYRGKTHHSRAGGFMMMEPGETHVTEKFEAPGNFWVLLLDPEIFVELVKKERINRMPQLKEVNTSSLDFNQTMKALYVSLNSSVSLLEKESRLGEVKRLFLERYSERLQMDACDPGHKSLLRVKEYLNAHFTEEVKLDTLASLAGIHPCYLDRLFKKYFGMTPKKYQACLRIESVKKDLVRGVPAALIDVGFCNQSHMLRVFKDLTRVCPMEYQLGKQRKWTTQQQAAPPYEPTIMSKSYNGN